MMHHIIYLFKSLRSSEESFCTVRLGEKGSVGSEGSRHRFSVVFNICYPAGGKIPAAEAQGPSTNIMQETASPEKN
jgi:hypothetical protein